ncbi:DNA-directed RNA polymerase subunit alpha C-terminal domain-containing protein [Blastococcus sp. SYSU DS1024]
MPTSSAGQRAGTIRDLGLPTRAVSALTRAGITDVEALAALTRRELGAVAGLGPGLVAAIRAVVPEPPAELPGAGAAVGSRPTGGRPGGDEPSEDDGPVAPAIPSFDSLRGPRRRSAVDLLLTEAQAPAPPVDEARGPAADRPSPGRAGAGATVRPPDYADLLRLGVHVARAVLGAPARCLHRLLGRGGPSAR